METQFQKKLEILINEYSKENDSDTPDFILARYLNAVLDNFNAAVMDREQWYNRIKHVEDINDTGKSPFNSDYYNGTGKSPPFYPSTTITDLGSNPNTDLKS